MPERIQRRRTKGWRMPADTIYVGRGSRWGNPFAINPTRDAAAVVTEFRTHVACYIANGVGYPLRELRGKNLACWCSLDRPCHADVLLELANDPTLVPQNQNTTQEKT